MSSSSSLSLLAAVSVATENQLQQSQETTVAISIDAIDNQSELPIVSHALSSVYEEGEEKFLREFEYRVVELVREFTRQFPYSQSIIWSIEYGENKEYCIRAMNTKQHA